MSEQSAEQRAEEYFQKLKSGYKRLTEGNIDADTFYDLSWLFSMAKDYYTDYCLDNGITPKFIDDMESPEKKPGKLQSFLAKAVKKP